MYFHNGSSMNTILGVYFAVEVNLDAFFYGLLTLPVWKFSFSTNICAVFHNVVKTNSATHIVPRPVYK